MTALSKEALRDQLIEKYGMRKGKALAEKFSKAFSTHYCEKSSHENALNDIEKIEKLSALNPLEIEFYQTEDDTSSLHLKLYQYESPIPLSDILPMIENMGLRTYSECPHQLIFPNGISIWMSDFSVEYSANAALDFAKVDALFEEAFISVRFGRCENDGFNKLVLAAGLSWREVTVIRAYAKYMHQAGFRFNQSYIENTVQAQPSIVKNLIDFFNAKFNLISNSSVEKTLAAIEKRILTDLEKVVSLDEDRILHYFLQLIKATLRTNYFQTTDNQTKEYLSFKLNSAEIPDLPKPKPLYEIFVYSPHFEAIHLRSAKVARGGIRWSDRREDFRTEILGLMKTQKVKNSVIVPSGAKGGFVLKSVSPLTSREDLQKEVIFCYQSFIRGLLDLTDNLKNNKIIPPKKTVCYDDPDPYLVVAADKGTASFSDIANAISKEYGFWLGDAFASGGSAGYDHKKIGITARGAWESIKRHFRTAEINIERQDFNVIGIGDMSGDVFGNGMIYSSHIRLIAAFDHRHIFLDPNPDAQKSYLERLRLFNLPTSSWENYNPALISTGGGVYPRSAKSITLTPEVKRVLAIEENVLTPNELIRAILKAPVDLLFNGGIGTYVKASTESHAEVGDKANDFCRVNGAELRCKIVGEGGNLGFTQLARVEYALQGGLINTDFIDNSAGVDCSDHEVNIKILLNKEMTQHHLTEKKRNQLLAKMTDAVADLVLRDNYYQALVMSFSSARSLHYTGLYQAYIKDLESSGHLDRAVEFLPDDKKLLERKASGQGLTSPELAVLLAYTKIHLENELLKSNVPDDPYFISALKTAFPATLAKLYLKSMEEHRLRREIIATQLSNQIVNTGGITFVYRLQMETGASIAEIIRAYSVAVKTYNIDNLHALIDSLNFNVPIKLQYELLHHVRQLLNLATRWFLRGNRLMADLATTIAHYEQSISRLQEVVPRLMTGVTKEYMENIIHQFVSAGLEESIARKIAISRGLYTALNVTEVATQNKLDLVKTAEIYFDIGGRFNLVWFRDQVANDNREGHWNNMARLALRDELDSLQRRLTIAILQSGKKKTSSKELIHSWLTAHTRIVVRWEQLIQMLHASTSSDYTMFFIALRELSEMVQID